MIDMCEKDKQHVRTTKLLLLTTVFTSDIYFIDEVFLDVCGPDHLLNSPGSLMTGKAVVV